MNIFNVISLMGGLALFLYGMEVMGQGLRQSSDAALKNVLEKATSNAFLGFLLGLVVTCIIQSSNATIFLTVGLVGAGMLTFRQSISVVLGANVGTTMTAQIIRLLDINDGGGSWITFFKPSTLGPLAAIIGIILIMFVKKKSSKLGGEIAIGFGILFTGLVNMTAAVAPLTESQMFLGVLERFSATPVLGFLTGTVVTLIVQSSSAAIGMIQTLCTTGALTFKAIYAIILGINIGSCIVTALISTVGATADGKRTGVVHIVYNVCASTLIIIAIFIGHSFGWLDTLWNKSMSSGDVANVHSLFKLSTAVILLPFTRCFEKAAYVLIKDDDMKKEESALPEIQQLNEKLFKSPALALTSVNSAISSMCALSWDTLDKSFVLFEDYNNKTIKTIDEEEHWIDQLADAVDNYMIKMSAYVSEPRDSGELNYFIQCFSEFERIGDFAVNLMENATELHNKGMKFSGQAMGEFHVLRNAIDEIMGLTAKAFIERDYDAALHVEPLEEVIDDLVAVLKNRHIERLCNGHCSVYSGLVFLDAMSNIERIADHCSNLALYTLSLHDETVKSYHDYVKELHDGNNAFFTDEFNKKHAEYFAALPTV